MQVLYNLNCMRYLHLLYYLVLFYFITIVPIYINYSENINEKYTLVEMKDTYYNAKKKIDSIDKHIFIFRLKNKQRVKIFPSIFYIEHNFMFDDLLFLVPLYNILVSTKLIVLCSNNENYPSIYTVKSRLLSKNYSTYSNCILLYLDYIKLLHLHSNIFRLCNYSDVYTAFHNNRVQLTYRNICRSQSYNNKYSIVTTVFKRNYLKEQLLLFSKQTLPPEHVIVVHDRNVIQLTKDIINRLVYFHTVNFAAGFYFRYLVSLTSFENNVIVYDDDWFPYSKFSHEIWLSRISVSKRTITSHHTGLRNNLKWCATPLIMHRKWMYLMWYDNIYDKNALEDGHLSFSLLLLCDIHCQQRAIEGLKYRSDNLSSSKNYITSSIWNNYIRYIENRINSSDISHIKSKYHIV